MNSDIAAQLTEIRLILARQEGHLAEHIRRTALLEEGMTRVIAELQPLKTHVAIWGALAKILGAVGTLVGIGAGVAKLLG